MLLQFPRQSQEQPSSSSSSSTIEAVMFMLILLSALISLSELRSSDFFLFPLTFLALSKEVELLRMFWNCPTSKGMIMTAKTRLITAVGIVTALSAISGAFFKGNKSVRVTISDSISKAIQRSKKITSKQQMSRKMRKVANLPMLFPPTQLFIQGQW